MEPPHHIERAQDSTEYRLPGDRSVIDDIELQSQHRATSRDEISTAAKLSEEPIAIANEASDGPLPHVSAAIAWRLYLSHLLSTWNSRSFEFGAVLFLAHIYPDTLLYLSIYAMCRSAAAIVLSTAIGKAIDRKPRLQVIRCSIVGGRIAVILSALGFWALWTRERPIHHSAGMAVFSGLVLLSCVEKAASIANVVSVERDWVVVIADGSEPALQKLNARMRRIDLLCKLAGPLFIALIDGASTTVAIWIILALNTLSMLMEYFAIAQVHRMVPKLALPKSTNTDSTNSITWQRAAQQIKDIYGALRQYSRHPACPPSFALALLYLTVLSFGGQMVTYLLAAGFNSFYIGLTRSLSVVVELSATWIAPRVMSRISPTRAAMWFLNWQILWLAATISFFWTEPKAIIAASGLCAGTILSRVGLWGYDLSAQVIIQVEVQEDSRGSFSSTEAAFQNAFELLSYALTIAMPRPNQFKYPTLVSGVAVLTAGIIYAGFLRGRRGHLIHVSCLKGHMSDHTAT